MDWNFFNLISTTIRDDRGRKVRCHHVADVPSSKQSSRDRLMSILTIISVLCVLFILMQAGAWLIAIFVFQSSTGSLGFLRPSFISLLLAAFIIMKFIFGDAVRTQRAHDRREALLAHRRCGACGYDLSSVAPASDGMRQCPECAAAWALEAWKPLPDGSASDYAKSRRNN
jgi:hypothetical protein